MIAAFADRLYDAGSHTIFLGALRNIDVPGWFPSAKIYAQDMLLFVVSATYSCIAPLTLVAGLCYFAGAAFVYKHQLLFVYVPICETGGKWWPKMARCFVVALLFAQCTMVGMMILKEAFAQSLYGPLANQLPLDMAASMDHEQGVLEADGELDLLGADDYAQPSLRAEIVKPDIEFPFPGEKSGYNEVFAPEAPYSDSDMIRVFEVLINQIGGIATIDATSPTMTKTTYILSSLANVKSCVVPVILSQSGVKAADELSIPMKEFENFAGYQEILECLLQPLLPAAKAENAAAYRLCGTVLRRVAATIQAPISTFINKILLDSDDNEEGGTELEQHVYFIIFELHKIAPSLLTRIIPTICQHMAIESETARLQCVKLMGKLFSSQLADYAQEFSRGFREFLGRWKDKSVAVRAEVVDCCAAILTKKPTLRKNIEEPLVFLLRDAEWEIRLSVLEKLLEVVLMDPHVLSDKSIEEIKERATDKRFEIRRTVLLGLAKIYN
eukprot:gene21142-21933_t